MPGTSRSYNSLEPSLSQSLGLDALSFSTANPVSFLATTNFLYSLAIMLSVLAAGFIYARAGLWRMQASEAGVRKSNEEIKRATLGLLGVLSLFVILYTFNKGLLSGEVGLEKLRTAGYTSGGGGNFGGGGATGEIPSTAPVTNGTEEANRAALRNAGIAVVSTSGQTTPCTQEQMKQSKPTCTNLADLHFSVIPMLIQLKDTCGTTFQITGGTEPGHNTHGPGKAAVDIDNNVPQLNECIKNKFTKVSPLSFCNAMYSGLGFVFCDEKNTSHWHVFK